MRPLLIAFCAVMLLLAWYLPNRPVDPLGGGGAGDAEKFSSLSFDAYGPSESPLTDRFPTEAEADAHMAVVARAANAVRTYAAVEGNFDTAALAQKYGVKVWQGIWLGGDRAKNEVEIARAVALAHKYPDTIMRVVVGNEVLLRRDLPVAELIAYIDRVKAAVRQPVAYADVWEFWMQFPQVAPHVDIMLIHLLPYWEDVPTGIDRAVAHVGDIYARMRAAFPGKQIAIGETGWPSRGRARADAVPSVVNETIFLRRFLALARAEQFDYNFIEAFDQIWKYRSEGIVGASWGVFDAYQGMPAGVSSDALRSDNPHLPTASRRAPSSPARAGEVIIGGQPTARMKIPLSGSVSNDPDWLTHAGESIAVGLLLCGVGLWRGAALGAARRNMIVVAGMALGGGLVFAAVVAWQTLFDVNLEIAAAVNVPAQAGLAVLAMLRLGGVLAAAPGRTGGDATEMIRALLTRLRVPQLRGLFEDICFLFVWTAAVMEMLLLCDGRYREFPLSTFAVPLLVTVGRLVGGDVQRGGGGREEFVVGTVLAGAAIGSAVLEGPLNGQSLVWNGCAVLLAGPVLLRLDEFFFDKKNQKTFIC